MAHKDEKVMVRVDPGIAREMRKMAALLEMPLYMAYEVACNNWISDNKERVNHYFEITGKPKPTGDDED